MTTLTAGGPEKMRSPWSFMASVCLHFWGLAWVAIGHTLRLEPAKSIFDSQIAPNEKHIVWYKLSEKLPEVKPGETKRDVRPPKASSRFEQQISAGVKKSPKLPQLILAPQPELHPAEPLPLPNIV